MNRRLNVQGSPEYDICMSDIKCPKYRNVLSTNAGDRMVTIGTLRGYFLNWKKLH